ncbi:MAG: hypothetical protein CME04_21330 [Gemmatimonadaceae bacterium]|nr:hypothetical protein [Gemmatimonadaceae bacterium]
MSGTRQCLAPYRESMNAPTNPLKILAYSLVNILIFMWLGSYLFALSGSVMPGGLSGEISVDAGEAIFKGAGKCSTCHSIGDEGSAVRCPNFGVQLPKFAAPIGIRGGTRKEGYTAIEYMVESVYDPNAYVVESFPANVMTPINRPPIALEDDQITSVLLYLLDKSGVEVTDEIIQQVVSAQRPYKGTGGQLAAEGTGPAIRFPEGDWEEGFYVFEEMKCFQCHLVEGADFDPGVLTEEDLAGGVGPDLTGIGAIQTYEYLMESVLDPSAVVLPDPAPDKKYSGEDGTSKMPDFLDTMTARQLLDLVAYLKSLGNEDMLAEEL